MNRNFDGLIGRLTPTLKRITHKLNGHFSFFDDDDLYQEALMHLWVLFQEGKFDDKTDSYILQGCYFHLKNHIRKTMDKAMFVSLNELIGDEEESAFLEDIIVCKGNSASERIDTDLLMEQVEMNGLTEREKTILALSLDGLTVREIGRRLGISHVMVVKIRRGLKAKCRILKNKITIGYQN